MTSTDCTELPGERDKLCLATMPMDMGTEDPGWDLLPDICTHFNTADESELGLIPAMDQLSSPPLTTFSPVFSCISPAPFRKEPPHCDDADRTGNKRPRTQDTPSGVHQSRSRVRFGLVAHVRRLTGGTGTTPDRKVAATVDDVVPIKQHDGPCRISVLISTLLVAFFGKGCCSVEQLLHTLGAEKALEICERGQEVFELCSSLAERLEAGGCVGMLACNVRLTAVHRPGVQQLAAWLHPQSTVSAEAVSATGNRTA